MSISVVGVSKRWGRTQGLKDVSLEVASGELVALLGPSGSGKTTLLRIIGGLEAPDSGKVTADPHVGFVFQHYALFRHMTVFENIAFGLRVRPRSKRPSNQDIRRRVEALLALVQLEGMAQRLPAHLSGGQRQRVALARALAVEPKVLLLDEPFGALDARVRKELRRWLRRLHDELHVTSLLVTHDQEDALEVADRVVVMNHGKIAQVGTPAEVMNHPADASVNEFMGEANVFLGRAKNGRVDVGPLSLDAAGHPDGSSVRALIRTHDVRLRKSSHGVATVQRVWSLGNRIRVDATLDGGPPLLAELPAESFLSEFSPGCRVDVEVTLARLYSQEPSA